MIAPSGFEPLSEDPESPMIDQLHHGAVFCILQNFPVMKNKKCLCNFL